MEKNHFLPHDLPSEGAGVRDLPPVLRAPRMERPTTDGAESGCGCEERPDRTPCACVEGCGDGSWGLVGYPLAMVYAPCQGYHALYDPATALTRGTLFTELDLPLGGMDGGAFVTEGCSCRAERRRV